jgi:hypothetical protein
MYAIFVMEIVDYIDYFSVLNEEKLNNFYHESYLCIMLQKNLLFFYFIVSFFVV